MHIIFLDCFQRCYKNWRNFYLHDLYIGRKFLLFLNAPFWDRTKDCLKIDFPTTPNIELVLTHHNFSTGHTHNGEPSFVRLLKMFDPLNMENVRPLKIWNFDSGKWPTLKNFDSWKCSTSKVLVYVIGKWPTFLICINFKLPLISK